MPKQTKADWPTALIAAAANLLPSMVVATLGIALPEVRQTLLLSEIEAGGLFSVIFVVAAVSSAVAGRLADKIGRKTVLLIGISTVSVGFALAGLSRAYPLMLVLLAITGLGYGFTTPSLYALMSDLVPARKGLGASLVSVAYAIGGSLGAIVSSAIIARTGWRAAFLTAGAFGIMITAVEMIGVRVVFKKRPTDLGRSFPRALNRSVIVLALAEFFGGSVFWSSASWTPTVLRTVKELSLRETGLVMGVWALTPMVGGILLGGLSDRVGRRVVILWSAFPAAAIAYVVYEWLASLGSLAIGFGLFGFLKATAPTLIIALAQESAAADSAGTTSGIILSMHYAAAVVAPLVAAQLIASTGDMILTMVLTAALPLVVYGCLIATIKEKRAAGAA
ncbi:MAG: MFS transporter [Deltaproteobacteria bacterium]|nr:MFS transporter [Deltaproteobacteria bacterium]